ncbi:carbohydrate-binding module family 21 protein [Amniculicola lignicola CBS 123094]|uniref:Carbohydrate-binding module family 21 protein n=1 Tax=Amniculicola lignicola CBS 123094 TaxID=1392246 RepID=A0A6A5W6T5_9PLEO|nr:carbohydrate-binding module family 21 protein [Amniculicola lignicola CBS 123094]
MLSNSKSELVRITQRIETHSEALSRLSNNQPTIEKQQHEAKIGTIDVLSALSNIVREQVRFGKDFTKLCQAWDPISHPNDAVPASMGRRLRKWHQSFPQTIQKLETRAQSLVVSTQAYKISVTEFASAIQILHRDGILETENLVEKIQNACVQEAKRLIQARESLIKARDRLSMDKSKLELDAKQLETRVDNYRPNHDGKFFSIYGGTLGLASVGMLAVCPPAGAIMGAISLGSSLLGLGITESSISKRKNLERDAAELSCRALKMTADAGKLEHNANDYTEHFDAVTAAAVAVKYLFSILNPMKSRAEILERASIQQCSKSSSVGLRVSGIHSSSAALMVGTSHEHLIDCVEAILSDFSYSDTDDRDPDPEWEISTPNLPSKPRENDTSLVRLEDIVLFQNHILIGTVAVKDLAFAKSVTARCTPDSRKTASEVEAEYAEDMRWMKSLDGMDRFRFAINLAQLSECVPKVVRICVKYSVNGAVHWDNNNGRNFKIQLLSDDLKLYRVLDELVAGLKELKVYENVMRHVRVLEDRDDYEELVRRRSVQEM